MSILLSGYFPEGIVFVADKNATIISSTASGSKQYVEPTFTKVLSWPRSNALIGFVGLGELAGLPLDEWLRVFIAGTRDFTCIDTLALQLHEQIQNDFNKDYPSNIDCKEQILIIHLGGFAVRNDISVPVMYHIWNHKGLDEESGSYKEASRVFDISEDFEKYFHQWWSPAGYPNDVRARIIDLSNRNKFIWYNNGAYIGAFNVFKAFIWQSLEEIRRAGFLTHESGIFERIAFCKMAVEVFSAYFIHHHIPEDRIVGGGIDCVYSAWPAI